MILPFATALLFALPALPALREGDAKDDAKKGPEPENVRVVSTHELALDGRELVYDATSETTLLKNDKGEAEAEFFTFTYALPGADPAERPLTFVFNGGPGSASVWLHMGLVGPRIVEVPSDARGAGAPPYPIADNPESLLAVSDLVFVDPIGTGFSRAVLAGDAKEHWGVDEDARSVARFVRAYLREHERWASPKYLLGESYGGIRGALLVRELQSGFDAVALNGVMFVSPAFDMEVVDGQDNDAAFATVIPTYAATAWYHEALPDRPAELEPFVAEVERFVEQEYVPALFTGDALSDSIVAKLHQYTGLSETYLRNARAKVATERFRRELLRDRGLVVGRLDARYTGTELDDAGEHPTDDPMASGISGAYVAAFHEHLARELDVHVDREYVVMSGAAGSSWKRPGGQDSAFEGYVDVTPALARGMAQNPELRVFVASGRYDLATTFYAAEYNVRRSAMDRGRVTMRVYPAGHMMYLNAPSRVQLARDLREFVEAGRAAEPAVGGGAGRARAGQALK